MWVVAGWVDGRKKVGFLLGLGYVGGHGVVVGF